MEWLIFSYYSYFTTVTNWKDRVEPQPLALQRRRFTFCLLHKSYYTPPLNSSLLLSPSYTSTWCDNCWRLRIINSKYSSFLSSFLPSSIVKSNGVPDYVVCLSDPNKRNVWYSPRNGAISNATTVQFLARKTNLNFYKNRNASSPALDIETKHLLI